MTVHVVVSDLAKRHGAVEAVRGVSFTIGRGETFGLLGPNGAGKTTTLECLVGLREPDRGRIEIAGVDVRAAPEAAKARLGAAFAGAALPDQITPREALRLFGAFYREREEPEALLARFSLTEKADARFSTLSTGQRQRLALALAFVNRPEFVVLDEPASGLDPQARHELHAHIAAMKRDGRTVLLATHDLHEAEKLCDRVAVIARGKIVADGPPRALAAGAASFEDAFLRLVADAGEGARA
jgi:ABC-2 type transport system ATP-binding protein